VYLNPTGVVNAASFSPFTTGIAPGEFIALYGSNLVAGSPQTASVLPFPTTLGGVQVMINNLPAPIYYVSSTQVLAIVPIGTEGPFASIQVMNNGVGSNTVTEAVNLTDIGVFLEPSGGILYGAILHQNGVDPVTSADPAHVGEAVSVYVTGLGDVSATLANPFGLATNQITADIDGIQATVKYSGLAPGLEGVYQVNVQVPADVTTGNATLEIAGPDSHTTEAVISVTISTLPSASAQQPGLAGRSSYSPGDPALGAGLLVSQPEQKAHTKSDRP
jgi:uncharacterized protein (TIGR03437 family)